jgi:hypothetical protein
VEHIDIGGYGPTNNVALLNGLDGDIFEYWWTHSGHYEGVLPDTFAYIGFVLFMGPWYPQGENYFQFYFRIPDEGIFCVDSCSMLPDYPWYLGDDWGWFEEVCWVVADLTVCGDANGNDDVNIGDAVYLISYIFKGGPPPVPLCAGDANGSQTISIGDIVYLVNYIFRGGEPPYEDCCGVYWTPTIAN